MKHYLLFYTDLVDGYVELRAQYREQHLALARAAVERNELILGGALDEPVDGAVLLFQGEGPEVAEDFAKHDPYVANGLVKTWFVRPWVTVVGENAAHPITTTDGSA
ncbi:YciI-like protein [Aliidiomarina sanyensis]|uniref:YCII-related domain-containing protein n=1 Tax=Aliidiomarina sanyensis TaxID=1249555 RepID=A0A432WAK5_9GAMM|nr:YciI-like protein [Aliidiomarina sanyensis]RUO27448.1 hypothetical protein CWE11_11735 [Aliidiomarina sanyensis]